MKQLFNLHTDIQYKMSRGITIDDADLVYKHCDTPIWVMWIFVLQQQDRLFHI